jgi:hypothetical protein
LVPSSAIRRALVASAPELAHASATLASNAALAFAAGPSGDR